MLIGVVVAAVARTFRTQAPRFRRQERK